MALYSTFVDSDATATVHAAHHNGLAVAVNQINTTPVTVLSRGAVSNGTTDDTAAVAQAITDCPTGGVVLFPPGNTRITTALTISKSLTLRGSSMYGSRILAVGCGGVTVTAGVGDFIMESIEVAAGVRYTTTTNALVGIKVDGSTSSRPANHVYRDVYVDGFATAFQSRYLWSSTFDNFRCNYGLVGMDVYGLSVNNFINNAQITVAQVANSGGIKFNGCESATDATAVASEGWTVSDSLIFGGEVGVLIKGTTHCVVTDNIIDYCTKQGVLITDNGTNFGGNSLIAGNYIAMIGATATASIQNHNGVNNSQRRLSRFVDNHCLAYAGATCPYGIYLSGAYGQSKARGNVLYNYTIDIYIAADGSEITENDCQSTPGGAGNIYVQQYVTLVANNVGSVYLNGGNPNVYSVDALGRRVWTGLQALTSGTNAWGDRVVHARPAVGSPVGWYCTVAGTPGTWVATANL